MNIDEERLDAELDLLWRGLHRELAEESRGEPQDDVPRRRSGRRRVAVVAALTAGSVAVAGAAAAGGLLHAHTGEYATGWEITAGGPGETLRTDAADFPAVLRDLTRDIPFAPGYQAYRDFTVDHDMVSRPQDGPQAISESAARAEVADQAICSWADSWVAADRAGDASSRDAATRSLVGALHWDAVTALDPHPHPDPKGHEGKGGERSTTRFGYLPGAAAAARAGDRAGLIHAVAPPGETQCIPEQLRAITWP